MYYICPKYRIFIYSINNLASNFSSSNIHIPSVLHGIPEYPPPVYSPFRRRLSVSHFNRPRFECIDRDNQCLGPISTLPVTNAFFHNYPSFVAASLANVRRLPISFSLPPAVVIIIRLLLSYILQFPPGLIISGPVSIIAAVHLLVTDFTPLCQHKLCVNVDKIFCCLFLQKRR